MAHNPHDDSYLFVFGAFRLDPQQRLLFRGTEVVPLEPKVLETLLALVEAAGRALTKDELLSRVWPDAFVEEGSLTRNISTLRKVLAPTAIHRAISKPFLAAATAFSRWCSGSLSMRPAPTTRPCPSPMRRRRYRRR